MYKQNISQNDPQDTENDDNQLEQQQDMQFIQRIAYDPPHRHGIKYKNNDKKKNINNMSRIDKQLIIIMIIAFICAFVGSYFVAVLQNAAKQQVIQTNRFNDLRTKQFFVFYQRYMTKNTNIQQYQVQYLYGNQIAGIVQYLIDQKCQQYQDSPMSVQQLSQKPQQQQDDTIKQIQVTAQQQQLQQKQQIQQKYFQQVTKINEQQIKQAHRQKPFQPVSGITKNKLQNAQKFKNFVKVPPWQCNDLCQRQYMYYDSIYHIGTYEKQLPFCIVVPTFNNQPQQRYKNNIISITQQNYTNYHVVIINDASTDKTRPLLSTYCQYLKEQWAKRGKNIKIDIYHNTEQQRAMPNLRKAAMEYCRPEQIYMIVDGDDYLIGKQVFKLFNSQFQYHGSWFVYSNFISFTGTIGYSRKYKQEVIEQNRYRKANFATSHLRAFYTKLFQLIKQEDLKDESGQYLRAGNDIAICIPILQMSHKKIHYIAQITYLYNSNTGLNNHMIRIRQQIDNSKLIRKRTKYEALESLEIEI